MKGISLFIVPKYLVNADGSLGAQRNDLVCASIGYKLGIHASPTAVMVFGENDGAIGYLVGEPQKAWRYMFTMMNHARLNVGMEGVAIAERAFSRRWPTPGRIACRASRWATAAARPADSVPPGRCAAC